jgi:hypothetical protein
MSRRAYARAERIIIGLMLVGIVGMFQPFAIDLYRYGFLLLLFSTILFIIISHVTPKAESQDAPGAVDLEQAAEHMQGHS